MNYTLPTEVLSAIDEAGYEVVEVRQVLDDKDLVWRIHEGNLSTGFAPHPSNGLYPILRKKPSEVEILRARLKEVEGERDSWKDMAVRVDLAKSHYDAMMAASLKLSPEVQAELDHAGCEATGEYRVTLRSDYGWLSPAGVVRLTCGVGTFAAEDCPRLILRKRSVPKSIACMEQDEHRNDLPAIAEPLVEYKPGEIP